MKKKGFSLIELLIAIALIAILAMILLPALATATDAAQDRMSCQHNLKLMGLTFKMYSGEWNGMWPPRSKNVSVSPRTYPEPSIPDLQAIYPKYMDDLKTLMCPSSAYRETVFKNNCNDNPPGWMDPVRSEAINPNCVTAVGYFYLSFLCKNNDTFGPAVYAQSAPLSKASVRQSLYSLDGRVRIVPYVRALGDNDRDMLVSEFPSPMQAQLLANNMTKMFRLREGITRFLITDVNNLGAAAMAESMAPAMFDNIVGLSSTLQSVFAMFNHTPPGINCLYMDGHVEFINYPGKFPCTTKVAGFVLN